MIRGEDIRKLVIDVSFEKNTGHVGSSLSVCEIIAAILNKKKSNTFVLSKGHAGLAYYAALYLIKKITKKELFSYCQDGSSFGVHAEIGQPDVFLSTGSLGMGLSVVCGMALADRKKEVFCLCSDAELDEGSTWEAIMFAAHHKLNNVTLIIDNNDSQALGTKESINSLGDSYHKFAYFNWDYWICPGHDQNHIETCLSAKSNKPKVIVANTIIGKGIPSMENDFRSHYLPLVESQVTAFRKENL